MSKIIRAMLCILIGSVSSVTSVMAETELEKIHQKIALDYHGVEHISAAKLAQMNTSDLLVFDVREKKEFAVSHIQGAVWLDPGIDMDEFEQKFSHQLKGKTVVFYCSVGQRSSELAEKVDDVIQRSEAKASYNLAGGVFTWRNEQRLLINQTTQPTTKVHPYNFYWGRLIEDKKAISYVAD